MMNTGQTGGLLTHLQSLNSQSNGEVRAEFGRSWNTLLQHRHTYIRNKWHRWTGKGKKHWSPQSDLIEKLRSASWASFWGNGTTMRTIFLGHMHHLPGSRTRVLSSALLPLLSFSSPKYLKFTQNFPAHLTFQRFKAHNCVWQCKILALLNYWRKADVIAWIIHGDMTTAVICNSLTFCFSVLSLLIGSSNDTLFYITECNGVGDTCVKISSKICKLLSRNSLSLS